MTLPLAAQTTQGMIEGFVVDSLTGNPIPGARVSTFSRTTNLPQSTVTELSGRYTLPLLSPGVYQIRAEAAGYQALQVAELVLPVAAVLSVPFRLRQLSNVWEQKQYQSVFMAGNSVLPLYGPDVDTSYSGNFEPPAAATGRLDTSLSDVIPPQLIQELPLQGRDVYTALVMEPGVTSDSATTRGIGVAVNGQRPASSNFLLDSSENNDSLISGPQLTLPPEAIQEFRFSTAAFSAEYGRTSGFVVNAVTHAGGERWHGIGYVDANRAGFNANTFQRNTAGLGRLPFYQTTTGFNSGGPVPGRKRGLFLDTALDWMWSHGDSDTQQRIFPSAASIARAAASNPNGYGVQLLERFHPPAGLTTPDGLYSMAPVTPTTTIHRLLGLQRFDVEPEGNKNHLFIRLAGGWTSVPDFNWSPYKGFSTALDDRTAGFNANLQTSVSLNLTNELRVASTYNNPAFPRPHPEIPNLVTQDQVRLPNGQTVGGGVWLPQAGTLYGYQNRSQVTQVTENLTWVRGSHIFKTGGDVLFRGIGGYLDLMGDGQLNFDNLSAFLNDRPSTLELGVDRLAFANGRYRSSDFDRVYRNRQLALFFEDSLRAGRRLSLNIGVRYDNFGAPVNVGAAKDDLVEFGSGPDMPTRIEGAQLIEGGGREPLFAPDYRNWAGRFGVSYVPGGGRTVLRGGYGIFYDRSFDNLWENLALNNVVLDPGTWTGGVFPYSRPLIQSLASTTEGSSSYNRLFMYQPGLRTPYVQSFFLGFQWEITRGIILETNYAGSLGRELITTDRINRQYSVAGGNGNFNSSFPEIFYRGNQGDANYDALTVKLSGSLRRSTFRLAYTWSHSIDNQSDPLAGEFDDLSFTNLSAGGSYGVSAFAQQFASGRDRGNSDFDQRHNLVGMAVWELPGALRGWHVSGLGAIRSGMPFTVYAAEGRPLYNARANLINPEGWRAAQAATGGKRLLNEAAFQIPADGTLGNSGRNAFPGPGFFSVDASLSRSFGFRRLRETDRLIFRADVFNLLNHVNLNNPLPVALGPPGFNRNFGLALYGRSSINDASPVLTPLQETTRQIHVIVRLEF